MKKGVATLTMAIFLLAGITGCIGGTGKPVNTRAEGELIKIGIINNDPSESGYRKANDKDLREKFTIKNGYDAHFSYSMKNDEQISFAKNYIESDVDYLLLSAADTTGWEEVLKAAKEAGVKVILFDRTIDADSFLYEASIISDMSKEGETAVAWLTEQHLPEYKIIHIQGVMGTAAQKGRSEALLDVVDENGWKIVEQKSAEWDEKKAQQIVQDVIDSGEDFNVIYAENDDMAKGAVAALDVAGISHGVGKDVIIMGFDCNRWALQELVKQNWNYDGQCSPFQASYIDEIIKKLEAGETISQKTIIMDEKGFDATTIKSNDVENYGI